MDVESFMHRGAHSCRDGSSLAEVARLMGECNCGFLPVVDADGRVLAVVTDRDVCLAFGLGDTVLKVAPGATVVTVSASDSLPHAQDLMRLHRVHRLPVVDGSGRPVGVLSLSDLARAADPGWTADAGGVTPTSVVFLLASVDRSELAVDPRTGTGRRDALVSA